MKYWNAQRGFGFNAREEGEGDVFVHISALAGSGILLCQGERVSFDLEFDNTRTNKEKATNVRLL